MGFLRQQIAERAGAIRWCHSLLLVIAMSAGAVAGGCSSNSTVATGPTQLKCQVALAAPSSTIGPDGGTGTITVTTSPECPWDVSTGATWLSGLSPDLGTRHRHGGVSGGAQSPAFSARGRNRRQRQPPASVAAGGGLPIGTPVRRPDHRCRQGVAERSLCQRRAAVHGPPRRTRVGSRSRRRSHAAATGAWVSASRQISAMSAAWARSSWGTSGSPSRRSQKRQYQGACI